ncbi:MAG TPA: MFS transporter [Anaerolineales bacterium]|nr:MFS transporter [Anaerolineales bacterium]
MQTTTSKNTILILTAGCFLSFFVFGFTDNLKGPTLPAMIAELNINYGTSGNIFFGQYLGFLITSFIAGVLADRFGLKTVLIIAGAFLFIGVTGYSSFQSAVLLGVSLFLIGLGLGAIELGANAAIVEAHPEKRGLYLNLMAVMHGLGSLLAPLFAGWFLSMNTNWRTIYRWDIALIALFIFLFSFVRFPKSKEHNSIDFKHIAQIAFKGNLPWFYFAIACYVAAEIGLSSWLVTFLQELRSASVTSSTQALSLFFTMLMLGRLGGGFIVQRLGYLRAILFASVGALVCLAAGTFTNFSVLLPITGLFFSIIFPTFTAAVSIDHPESTNSILGILFTFAGLGGLIGPWAIAWASDLMGLQLGFSVGIIFTALLLWAIFVLEKGKRNG